MIYENILFDLYGTLADIRTDETMPFLWRVLADKYKRSGAVYTPSELQKSFYKSINALIEGKDESFEVDIKKTFEALYADKNVEVSKEVILDTAKEFRKASTIFLNLYDGVYEGLETLKKAGKKIYLLSNAQKCFTFPELESLGIVEFFDDIFISSDYGVKKPSSEFFKVPFDKYGLKKEKSIMVGNDGVCDILGAQSFGIDSMYVKTEISPKEDLPNATYVFVKHDFANMVKILLS